jgi:hypothetical protein
MKKPTLRAAAAALSPAIVAGSSLCVSLAHAADQPPRGGRLPEHGGGHRHALGATHHRCGGRCDGGRPRTQIDRSGAAALADVLARVPGILVTRNGGPATTTSVYLRGAETRFTAVFVDGVRIDSQSTGGATWNAIPLSQVERIEVLRGPAAAIYGSDAMAGVVQIFTREGEKGLLSRCGWAWVRTAPVRTGGSCAADRTRWTTRWAWAPSAATVSTPSPAGNPDRDGYRNESSRAAWAGSWPGPEAGGHAARQPAEGGLRRFMPGQDDQSQHHLQTVGLNWNSPLERGVEHPRGRHPWYRPLRNLAVALPDRHPQVDTLAAAQRAALGQGLLRWIWSAARTDLRNGSTTPERRTATRTRWRWVTAARGRPHAAGQRTP